MDGIHDDSSYVFILSAWDSIETIFMGHGHILWVICVALGYAYFFHSRLNLTIIILSVLWLNPKDTYSAIGFPHVFFKPVTISFVSVGALFLALASRYCFNNATSRAWAADEAIIPCEVTRADVGQLKSVTIKKSVLIGKRVSLRLPAQHSNSAPPRVRRVGSNYVNWATVNPRDHLEHVGASVSLNLKLRTFLESQEIDPEYFKHAYLVTGVKILGFCFPPRVSVWYLYSINDVLSALILETHSGSGAGEPCMAFAVPGSQDTQSINSALGLADPRIFLFEASITSDLSLLGLGSKAGKYTIRTTNPYDSSQYSWQGLKIAIGPSDHNSTGQREDLFRLEASVELHKPGKMKLSKKLAFISTMSPMVGTAIVTGCLEYLQLHPSKDCANRYEHERANNASQRFTTTLERDIKATFEAYLFAAAEASNLPVVIHYLASGSRARERDSLVTTIAQRSDAMIHVQLEVLTPEFYTRFIGYAHDMEAIFCELRESKTISTDKPEILGMLFLRRPSRPLQTRSLLDFATFSLIRILRRRPLAIKSQVSSPGNASALPVGVDIRKFHMSAMDAFILSHYDNDLKRKYRSAVLQYFLAERFLLGSIRSLSVIRLLVRLSIAWTIAKVCTTAFMRDLK